jgi:dsRNA-specific ribonuclease
VKLLKPRVLHEKEFTMAVFVKEKECGRGIGASKKLASQLAAENALQRIQEEPSLLQVENFS